MKTMLSMFLVLVVTTAASATTTVTLVPIQEGEPGSATNPLQPSDTLCVYLTSDAGLIGLDAVLCVVYGPATIIDAVYCPGPLALASPCLDTWPCDPVLSFDPWPPPPGPCVEIGMGTFGPPPSGIVGWWLLHCDDVGLVTVELTPGTAFGGSIDENFMPPDIFGTLEIHQAPEPNCWDGTECVCQPYGDGTCNGQIDLADLFAFKAAFGKSAPWTSPYCCSDYNHDGSVDLGDLYGLKGNWGLACPAGPSTRNQNCP